MNSDKKHILFLSAFCILQSRSIVANELPEYQNEYGEEVFSPNYLPENSTLQSEPLLIGEPNASVVVLEAIRGRSQTYFSGKMHTRSLPKDRGSLQNEKAYVSLRGEQIFNLEPRLQRSNQIQKPVIDDEAAPLIKLQ